MKRTTLRDVAAASMVDISTVSKVLSGEITVRPETRERIEAEAARLRYTPNSSARSLRISRTGALGFLVPDFSNPVYAAIVRGAVREADERGLAMLFGELTDDQDATTYARLVAERRIDGLLVASARGSGALSARLRADHVPHVSVNRRASTGVSVTMDDEAGAAAAATELIDHGHVRMGIISGPKDVDTAIRRLAGFRAAIRKAGLPAPLVARCEYSAQGGAEAMDELLSSRHGRPTGVFASNFMVAFGALESLWRSGLRVPDEMSVITFEDALLAPHTIPPLTTVDMPFSKLGVAAVESLARIVDGGRPRSRVIPLDREPIIRRRSVSRPA